MLLLFVYQRIVYSYFYVCIFPLSTGAVLVLFCPLTGHFVFQKRANIKIVTKQNREQDMNQRRAVFADEKILQSENARKRTVVGQNGVISDEMDYKGWKFKSSHTNICKSDEILKLARHIEKTISGDVCGADDNDNVVVDGVSMRLPPM